MKRSPMPTRTARLRTGRALVRGTPLRRVSARQRRVNATRGLAVAALLAEHPWCQARLAGCSGRATDGHELLRRSQGGDPTRPDKALCRPCHAWVTEHPMQAVTLGLAVWGWEAGTGR